MMYRAMDKFKTLDQNVINAAVRQHQRQEIRNHEIRVEQQTAKKRKISDDDYEILCKRCSAFACLTSDVRLYHESHHVVADEGFLSRFSKKAMQATYKYDGIENKFIMCCGTCSMAWGIIADSRGVELRMLKCKNLKFKNVLKPSISQYKKWCDVPYQFKEVTAEDIPALFGSG